MAIHMMKFVFTIVMCVFFFPRYTHAATTTPVMIPSTEAYTILNSEPSSSVLATGSVAGAVVSREGVYERAVVEKVTVTGKLNESGGKQVELYQVKILAGALKNQMKEITSDVSSNPYGLKLRQGDKIIVLMQQTGDEVVLFVEGYDRRGAMYGLIALFFFVMILLAGWQGFKVAFSILFSVVIIGWVLIPSFLRGINPIPVAIVLSGLLTFVSTGMSTGWNRKSVITAIGTIGGSMIAFLIASIFASWAKLNGLATEDDRLFFEKNPLLNPRGLMLAGVIIASAGVVEDVAVSIASGISEVFRANQRMSFKELFRSGMVIGNDHMSALANTLVFAYVGSSLSTLLLYEQFGSSWLKFINFDSITDEVIRSLAGTIGLVFTVPITAFLAAWVVKKEKV